MVHIEDGIIPGILDLKPKASIDDKGFAKTESTVEARAVWGDLDKLGCPPDNHGWRVSKNAPKGMKIFIRTPIPPDWTHVVAQHFHDYVAEDGRTKRSAICVPYNTGRNELYQMLVDFYKSQTEWETAGFSKYLENMLSREKFDANFAKLLVAVTTGKS